MYLTTPIPLRVAAALLSVSWYRIGTHLHTHSTYHTHISTCLTIAWNVKSSSEVWLLPFDNFDSSVVPPLCTFIPRALIAFDAVRKTGRLFTHISAVFFFSLFPLLLLFHFLSLTVTGGQHNSFSQVPQIIEYEFIGIGIGYIYLRRIRIYIEWRDQIEKKTICLNFKLMFRTKRNQRKIKKNVRQTEVIWIQLNILLLLRHSFCFRFIVCLSNSQVTILKKITFIQKRSWGGIDSVICVCVASCCLHPAILLERIARASRKR